MLNRRLNSVSRCDVGIITDGAVALRFYANRIPPIPYDLCIGIPISCLIVIGVFSVIVKSSQTFVYCSSVHCPTVLQSYKILRQKAVEGGGRCLPDGDHWRQSHRKSTEFSQLWPKWFNLGKRSPRRP